MTTAHEFSGARNVRVVSARATAESSADIAGLTAEQLTEHVARIRSQLASTLDAVEEKVNISKRLDKAVARGQAKLRTMRQENPLALAALAAAALAVAGVVTYAAYRSITRR
jgi:hypothetical protein